MEPGKIIEENTNDNVTVRNNDNIVYQCLVCLQTFDGDTHHETGTGQLKDLLKVFQMSASTFESLVDLPGKLFCNPCSGRILEAVKLLYQIECLQNEFKLVETILEESLLKSTGTEGTSWTETLDHVRKTLVQCFSSCVVRLTPTEVEGKNIYCDLESYGRRVSIPREVTDLEYFDDSFLHLLSPVTVLTPGFSPKSKAGFHQIGGTTSQESGESSNDEIGSSKGVDLDEFVDVDDADEDHKVEASDGDYKRVGVKTKRLTTSMHQVIAKQMKGRPRKDFPFRCNHCGKGYMSQNFLSLHEASHIKSKAEQDKKRSVGKRKASVKGSLLPEGNSDEKMSNRSYDSDGKLTAYECSYCGKKLAKDEYRNEDGTYIFKCFPECCSKITDNFPNLVSHHSASCPSKPLELFSNSRKNRKAKKPSPVDGDPQGSTSRNSSFKYDASKAVIGFECPTCKKLMSRADYQTETGEFVFKCEWDSCDKITSNFSNLTYHHQTHCSNRPRKPKWKSSKKWKSAYRVLNKRKCVATTGSSRSENGREYDATGRIVGFECPRCAKKISYADFVDAATNTYVFKCFPTCCEKVFTTFPNLVFHHEARCSPIAASTTVCNFDETGKLESFLCLICNENIVCGTQESFKCHLPDCDQVYTVFQELHSHHENHCTAKLIETGQVLNPIYSIRHRKLEATGLMKHSLRQKKGKTFEFTCQICGKGYDKKVSFEEHLKCHDGVLAFQCKLCHRKFSNEANLVKHARHHELAKEQRCTKPERMLQPSRKQFCPEGNLASYHCQHCEQIITKSESVHGTGEHENEYRCWLNCCDRNFIHFTAMVVHHVANCPMKKPSVCEVCGRSFPTTWKLRLHIRDSHTKVDPLYCDQCGKAFSKKVDLIRHMVTHSDEKPFACAHCPCRYKRRKNLKIHMRLHNDERPFMCSTCGKTFRSSSILHDHEKTHGTEFISCSFCNKMLRSKRDLDAHVTKNHNYAPVSGNLVTAQAGALGTRANFSLNELSEQQQYFDAPSQDSGSGSHEVQDYSNRVNNTSVFLPTGFNWK